MKPTFRSKKGYLGFCVSLGESVGFFCRRFRVWASYLWKPQNGNDKGFLVRVQEKFTYLLHPDPLTLEFCAS